MATASPISDLTAIEPMLQSARQAAYALAVATTEQKNQALMAFASLIESNVEALLAANQLDLAAAQQDGTSAALVQRLGLNTSKIQQLVQGIRDVARLSDPIGTTFLKTQLDDGLVLSKVAVPLGVIGIIFESRPDVIPQVLSLILKSGNAVVLKGGKEATHSNRAFMALVQQLNQQCPWLPAGWAQLLDSREAAMAILKYPQYVDLIIPRGSNQLVQAIMAGTSIPVLGHADGICHLYVHPSADLVQALPLILDAKTQYPAACNALETVLVDTQIAQEFLPTLAQACQAAGVTLKGCPASQQIATDLPGVGDWRTEYGDLTLAVRVVDGLAAAIDHIHTYGSHHTDGILATDPTVCEQFLQQVDSANVYANASTRFADGFRYGFGAEIGISTARTHARGPVGLEGLVTYKYQLRGQGHTVAPYTGPNAKVFQHTQLV